LSSMLGGRPGPTSGLHMLTGFSLKRLVSWGDSLKVDQPQLDAQHQAIFEIALEIADLWHKRGDLDQLKAAADKLAKVLGAHFRFEEQELADLGYTRLAVISITATWIIAASSGPRLTRSQIAKCISLDR
jgi:hypothetical protein